MALTLWRRFCTTSGDAVDPMSATVNHMLDVYLSEKLQNEGTRRSARSFTKYIRAHFGDATLADFHRQPGLLVRYFKDFPGPKNWAPKTVFNYFRVLSGSISYFIKSRGLSIKNPCIIVTLNPGTRVREEVPTGEEFERLVSLASRTRKPYIANLLIAGWETGLRRSEILAWRWEHMELNPPSGLPYYLAFFRKQKRLSARQRPMSMPLWVMLRSMEPKQAGPVWPVKAWPERTVRELRHEAGLGHLQFHDFRKSWKTDQKAAGVPESLTEWSQCHSKTSDEYYSVFKRRHLEKTVLHTWSPALLHGFGCAPKMALSECG